MKRLLRWLVPAGFRGQVAAILIVGVVLSQVLAGVLYVVALPQWQRVLRPDLAISKVGMVVRLLESVPRADRESFARLWDEPQFQVRYQPAVAALPRPQAEPDLALRAQLIAKLQANPATVQATAGNETLGANAKLITVLLAGGGAVQIATPVGLEVRVGLLEELATGAFLVFATAGLWFWVTWTVNQPLDRFARAAERVGVDVHSPPLAVHGPLQLQRAIRAFNEMQVRLQRLLTDRTLMLGAISHDLGTPLTRLRLRVETDRADDKEKMLADIEAMQIMLTSALSFVRGVDDAEPREVVDLDSLLQTVCDLVSDLGGDVTYGPPKRSNYFCKPQAMLRALTNLVTNAAKYGEHATVTLQPIAATGFIIEIQDDGPGIPEGEKAKVFEPFYRTDQARESDRQGMGLGLSIARSIILAHGGTIELRDREPNGLTVHLFLPATLQPAPVR
ncbi:MAG TPA: ATP-binding protein [Steroidobacteraceae bacterium]|nr:ATP-binding protein [Steroidobacteraceae bacterium]